MTRRVIFSPAQRDPIRRQQKKAAPFGTAPGRTPGFNGGMCPQPGIRRLQGLAELYPGDRHRAIVARIDLPRRATATRARDMGRGHHTSDGGDDDIPRDADDGQWNRGIGPLPSHVSYRRPGAGRPSLFAVGWHGVSLEWRLLCDRALWTSETPFVRDHHHRRRALAGHLRRGRGRS